LLAEDAGAERMFWVFSSPVDRAAFEKYLRDSARKAAMGWKFNATDGAAIRSVRLTFIFHGLSYVAPDKKPEFTSPYQVEIQRVAMP